MQTAWLTQENRQQNTPAQKSIPSLMTLKNVERNILNFELMIQDHVFF